MPYCKHRLGKTYFVARGRISEEHLPLIFLHGGPGGRHEFNSPLLRLSKKRRVYLYDQLGSGKSSVTSKRQWNIETFVSELDELIKKWGLNKFHLGGSSWGTTLALEYYLKKKGKGIESLVFSSPMFSAYDWSQDAKRLIKKMPPKVRHVIESCHKIGAEDSKVYQEAVMAYYTRHVLRDRKRLETLMTLFSEGNANGGRIYQYMWGPSEFQATGTLKNYSRVAALRRIKVPTLLMCGQFDEATSQTVKGYHRMVKSSQFELLRGCSHIAIAEKPQVFLKVVEGFLRGVEGSKLK